MQALPRRNVPARFPVRVGLTVIIILVAILNVSMAHAWSVSGISDTVMMALIGLVATTVAGDTYRPSGMGKGTAPPSDTDAEAGQ